MKKKLIPILILRASLVGYGLQEIECIYEEYPDLRRFVIYWKYE